nr:MAG TPA: hypothetical protein [Caudoviricetes sp.]
MDLAAFALNRFMSFLPPFAGMNQSCGPGAAWNGRTL